MEEEARRNRTNTDVLKLIFWFETAVIFPCKHVDLSVCLHNWLSMFIYLLSSVHLVLYCKRLHLHILKVFFDIKLSRIHKEDRSNSYLWILSFMKSLHGIYGFSLPYLSPEKWGITEAYRFMIIMVSDTLRCFQRNFPAPSPTEATGSPRQTSGFTFQIESDWFRFEPLIQV